MRTVSQKAKKRHNIQLLINFRFKDLHLILLLFLQTLLSKEKVRVTKSIGLEVGGCDLSPCSPFIHLPHGLLSVFNVLGPASGEQSTVRTVRDLGLSLWRAQSSGRRGFKEQLGALFEDIQGTDLRGGALTPTEE